jgi:chemotaxis protein CheX
MTTELDVFVPTPADLASLTELVWASFVDGAIYPDPAAAEREAEEQVVASVAISGEWNGHVLVGATPVAARKIAAAMFDMTPESVSDDDLADAFGEIANILGGNVKGLLPEPSVLSLPQIVLDTRQVRMPSTVLRSRADLFWDGEPVNVSVWEGPTSHNGGM